MIVSCIQFKLSEKGLATLQGKKINQEIKWFLCICTFHNCLSEVQWNLSNPTHQGTREMHRIVQDVRILRFYLSEHKFLSDVTG